MGDGPTLHGVGRALLPARRVPLALPRVATETALRLPPDLSLDHWAEVGARLGRIGRAVQWWIGDWVNYGESRYGEKHAQHIEATGYDYSTVAHCAWVASRFEFMRRRINLSWSHHREVAAMEPADQDAWLDAAEKKGLTHKALRAAVREAKKELPTGPASDGLVKQQDALEFLTGVLVRSVGRPEPLDTAPGPAEDCLAASIPVRLGVPIAGRIVRVWQSVVCDRRGGPWQPASGVTGRVCSSA